MTLSEITDKASEEFEITGTLASLRHEFTGTGDFAVGNVYLESERSDLTIDVGLPPLMPDQDETAETMLHISASRYYQDIKVAGFDGREITVEQC